MGNHKVQIILELMNRVSQPMRDVVDKFGKLNDTVRGSNSAIKLVPNSIEDVRSKLNALTLARDKAFTRQGIIHYNNEIQKLQRELRKLENLPAKSFFGRMNSLPGMVKGAMAGVGVAFAVSKVVQFAGNVVRATADVEKYKLTLETMLGSKAAADARMSEYQNIAAKTPFELPEVVELGNGLQALGRYSRQNVIMLGDLASAAGKPLDQVRMAYSKLATGQKGEAVNLFRDLLITTDDWVKATGKGVSKNGELMATTEEMLAALPKIMSGKHFEGMMEKQAQGIHGRLSNLKDDLFQFMAALGELLKPFIDSVITILSKITQALGPIVNFMSEHKELFGAIALGITAAAIAWGVYSTATWVAAGITKLAAKGIGKAIMGIPIIGWIAAAITAIVTLVAYFWKTSATFRGVLMGMWEAAKAIFGGIGEFMMEVLGGVKDLILAVFNPANWFDGEDQFGAALDRIKNAASKYGKAIKEGYNKGMAAGKASFEEDKKKKKEEIAIPGTTDGTTGGEATGDDATSTDVGGITSGGSRPTNITINLGKLHDQIVIHAATVKEGVQEMEQLVTEAMLRVLNSGNAVQTGGGS